MDLLTPDRILTLAGFLGLLILLWAAIRFNRAPLAARLKGDRRMEVAEVLPLGGDARAILMRADGHSVLIVTGRKGGTAMLPLAAIPETGQ
ncbi:MAG: flagellar assembly protein FliO [Roseovarius sp.]|uniref:flagellar assembly protein FliO n=1 Tax=Roseovarius sp. TaxID=1486281 RepID=UPI0032EBA72D